MKTVGTPRNVKSLRDGTVVLKSSAPGGMRQIRCPSCNGIAVPTTTPRGNKPVNQCGTCNRSFTVTRM